MTMNLVVDHLWQSTLVAAAVALLTLVFGARTRHAYGIWLAASVKFLIPFAALTSLGAQLEWREELFQAPPEWTAAIDAVRQRAQPLPPDRSSSSRKRSLPPRHPHFGDCWRGLGSGVLILLVSGSCDGGACRARFARNTRCLGTGARHSRGSRFDDQAADGRSDTSLEPGVFGIVRPVLLWPREIEMTTRRCTDRAVLAHELAHVRRRDNLRPRSTCSSKRCSGSTRSSGGSARASLTSASARATKTSSGWHRAGRLRREHPEDLSVLRRVAARVRRWRHRLESQETSRADHVAPPGRASERAGEAFLDRRGCRDDRGAREHRCADDSAASCRRRSVSRERPPRVRCRERDAEQTGAMRVMMRVQPGGAWQTTNVTLESMIRLASPLQESQLVGGPSLDLQRSVRHRREVASGRARRRVRAPHAVAAGRTIRPDAPPRDRELPRLRVGQRRQAGASADRVDGRLRRVGSRPKRSAASCVTAWRAADMRNDCGTGPAHRRRHHDVSAGANALALHRAHGPRRHGAHGRFRLRPRVRSRPALPRQRAGRRLSAGVSIFTAVQQQLGLRLDSRRAPVDVLVIDSAAPPQTDGR